MAPQSVPSRDHSAIYVVPAVSGPLETGCQGQPVCPLPVGRAAGSEATRVSGFQENGNCPPQWWHRLKANVRQRMEKHFRRNSNFRLSSVASSAHRRAGYSWAPAPLPGLVIFSQHHLLTILKGAVQLFPLTAERAT